MNELDKNVTVMFMGGVDEDLYKSSMEKKGQMKVNISFEESFLCYISGMDFLFPVLVF